MKKSRLTGLFASVLLFIPAFLFSQSTQLHVFEEWVKLKGVSTQVYKSVSKKDNSSNLIVAGGTLNANGNYDWLITKYSSTGAEIWTTQYNGAFNEDDYITDIVIDNSNNIYVTGVVSTNAAQGWDLGVAKYNSLGVQQWIKTYDNGLMAPLNADGGTSIVLDASNNVYVTGGSMGGVTLTDFVTLKYSNTGSQLWVKRFDSVSLNDLAAKISFKAPSNIIVTGGSERLLNKWRTQSVKYDLNGNLISQNSSTPLYEDDIDIITDIAEDAAGNIYVTGMIDNSATGTGKDIKVIKLSGTLDLVWTRVWNGATNQHDEGNAIRVDNSGNIYVAGYSTNGSEGKNYLLLKYNSLGTLQWNQTYNGVQNGDDVGKGVEITAAGDPIITGSSAMEENTDFYTIKYNSTSALQWQIGYNGLANKNDKADEISIDPSGNIFITGRSQDSSGVNSKYIIVKYIESTLYNIPDDENTPSSFDCVENRGQLLNDNLTVNNNIKYYSNSYETSMYLGTSKIAYVRAAIDTADVSDTLQRVDMVFSLTKSQQPYAWGERGYYSNYYFPHTFATKGLTRVPSYEKFVYPNMYPNIDVQIGANSIGYKIYFVVKPGGTPSNISYKINGANSLTLGGSGELMMGTFSGNIKYLKARCYQIAANGARINLGWQPSYIITSGNTVGFTNLGIYDPSLPLIFEMYQGAPPAMLPISLDNLDWSTYYGSGGTEDAKDIDDDESNTYICGASTSNNLPIQVGVTSSFGLGFAGGQDGYYVKFSPFAELLIRTYFGGSGNEVATSITHGKDLVIVGYTSSIDWYNYSNNGLNNTTYLGGLNDGFIFTINPAGTFVKCDSYIGGSGDDVCKAVASNSSDGSKYAIVGTTFGTNFQTVSQVGEYIQSIPISTNGEGFVIRMDVNFTPTWATLFGGAAQDHIIDVKIDNSGNITAYGQTREINLSTTNNIYPNCLPPSDFSFPICIRGGAYNQPTAGGGFYDMFLAEFDASNKLVWSTLFGTDGEERIDLAGTAIGGGGMDIDDNSNIYITGGIRDAASGIPFSTITPTSYSQTSYIPYQIGFISKFENRYPVWYTLFGGNSTDATSNGYTMGSDIVVDAQGFIFVTGTAEVGDIQSLSNYCTNPTMDEFPMCNQSNIAYMETDFNYTSSPASSLRNTRTFIAGFDPSGNIIWSTRYGNGTDNYATAITATDVDNKVYIVGGARQNTAHSYTTRNLLPLSNLDYFDDTFNGGPVTLDAVIARFSGNHVLPIENEQTSNGLSIYPNPTDNFCNIVSKDAGTTLEQASIMIYDISGKVMTCNTLQAAGLIQVNMESLSPGLYILKINDAKKTYTYKIIKN